MKKIALLLTIVAFVATEAKAADPKGKGFLMYQYYFTDAQKSFSQFRDVVLNGTSTVGYAEASGTYIQKFYTQLFAKYFPGRSMQDILDNTELIPMTAEILRGSYMYYFDGNNQLQYGVGSDVRTGNGGQPYAGEYAMRDKKTSIIYGSTACWNGMVPMNGETPPQITKIPDITFPNGNITTTLGGDKIIVISVGGGGNCCQQTTPIQPIIMQQPPQQSNWMDDWMKMMMMQQMMGGFNMSRGPQELIVRNPSNATDWINSINGVLRTGLDYTVGQKFRIFDYNFGLPQPLNNQWSPFYGSPYIAPIPGHFQGGLYPDGYTNTTGGYVTGGYNTGGYNTGTGVVGGLDNSWLTGQGQQYGLSNNFATASLMSNSMVNGQYRSLIGGQGGGY